MRVLIFSFCFTSFFVSEFANAKAPMELCVDYARNYFKSEMGSLIGPDSTPNEERPQHIQKIINYVKHHYPEIIDSGDISTCLSKAASQAKEDKRNGISSIKT